MSAGSIIGGGIRVLREQPRIVATWAAIYLAVTAIGMIVMQPWTSAMAGWQQQVMQAETPPALPAGSVGLFVLLYLALLILAVIAFAAVVRAVVRPMGDRFAYLRLGKDELRLIGLGFILLIAFFLLEIVAILAVVLLSGLVALVAGHGAAAVVAGILLIAVLCGIIYVQVRVSLAGALTVMRGRIAIRDAWRVTQGRFWTLFGAFVLLGIMFVGVTIITIALTSPGLLTVYLSFDQEAIAAIAQEQIARQAAGLTAGMVIQIVVSTLATTVAGVIACGAVATAALEFSDPEFVGAELEQASDGT